MGGIIWLASYPKSGNTWLRAYLHNLLRNPEKPANINQLDQFCLGDSQAYWYHNAGGVSDLSKMSMVDVAKLRPLVHKAFTKAHSDSVFAKTHNLLGEAFGVPTVTMEHTVGGIYVLRNPLDMVMSMSDHYGISLDEAIEMLADPEAGTGNSKSNAFEFYGTWSQHVHSWTAEGNDSLIHVRYEDMAGKSKQTFARIAAFLGLSPSKARLEKAIRFSSFKVLQGQERKDGFRERSQHSKQFFRSGKVGIWRSMLSEAQVDKVTADHHEQMDRFGYLP